MFVLNLLKILVDFDFAAVFVFVLSIIGFRFKNINKLFTFYSTLDTYKCDYFFCFILYFSEFYGQLMDDLYVRECFA